MGHLRGALLSRVHPTRHSPGGDLVPLRRNLEGREGNQVSAQCGKVVLSDVYNSLPVLSHAEKQALLDRAVIATVEARGCPAGHDAQQAFDLAVDVFFALSCCLVQHSIAAALRQMEDEAALEG